MLRFRKFSMSHSEYKIRYSMLVNKLDSDVNVLATKFDSDVKELKRLRDETEIINQEKPSPSPEYYFD